MISVYNFSAYSIVITDLINIVVSAIIVIFSGQLSNINFQNRSSLEHAYSGIATVEPSGALAPPSVSVAPPSANQFIT